MRNLTIAVALASTVMTSPALARDNGGYVGVEGGLLKAENVNFDFDGADGEIDNIFEVDHKTGYDLDLIAGYDFGFIRAEGELAYKRASIDEVRADATFAPNGSDLDADGRTRVLSGMINLLLDFGDDDGLSGFLGGGGGLARLKMRADVTGTGLPGDLSFRGIDRSFAWQGLAGVRYAVSDNIDVGVKYRFFNTKFDFEDGGDELAGKFRSHSLLASLIYNFGAAEPPPPPPPPPAPPAPPPPATQTCPDGSVILVTDACPVPPPPPPPPAPEPERG